MNRTDYALSRYQHQGNESCIATLKLSAIWFWHEMSSLDLFISHLMSGIMYVPATFGISNIEVREINHDKDEI